MNPKTSFHWTMHSILGLRVDSVQSSVKKYGGYCLWPFSQLKKPVKSLIGFHQDSTGGVCEMLSAKWLEEHAKGGSIVNWMTKADGDIIDACKVRQLMQLSVICANMCRAGVTGSPQSVVAHQTKATETWLRSRGIVKRRQITGGLKLVKDELSHPPPIARIHGGGASRRDFSEHIAQQIVQSNASYKMIEISGEHLAHTMAAWSDRDVSFFDPNFGEFWFSRPHDFVKWFPSFWHIAGYGAPTVGLSKSFAILEYGMPASHEG